MHLLKDSDHCIGCPYFMEEGVMCISCLYKEKEVNEMDLSFVQWIIGSIILVAFYFIFLN